MVPEQSIRIIRSQDLILQFTMAAPTDITGWSVTFLVLTALGGSTQITKTVGAGITITDAGRGILQVSLGKADTSGLAIQDYVWGLKRTDNGNNMKTWEVHPQTGLINWFPPGEEISVKGGNEIGIRMTAAAAQTVSCNVYYEE